MDRKTKRLNWELLEQDHIEIKKRAAIRNMTIKDWVMMAIIKQIKEEQQYES